MIALVSRRIAIVLALAATPIAAAGAQFEGLTHRQACRPAGSDTVMIGDARYEMFYSPIPRRQVIEGQLERTTFSPLQGVGTLPPLLFEATIASHFIARETPDDWTIPPLIFAASMHSHVRMSMDDSKPVRTPSYSPRLTVYYGRQRTRGCNVWFTTFAHYSNGQDGPAFIGGQPNLVNGNFSTNYAEAGYSWAAPGADQHSYLRLSNEFHFAQDDSVKVHYGFLRPHAQLLLFYRRTKDTVPDYRPGDTLAYNRLLMEPAASSGRLAPGFLLQGDLYALPLSEKFPFLERFSGTFTLMWQPMHLEDFGYFMSFAFGRDLYNIWYDSDYLQVLRFGIMGNSRPLSFGRYVAKRRI